MRVDRSPVRSISDVTVDADIDMNSHALTELGNMTFVTDKSLQLLAALAADKNYSGITVLATAGEDVDQFQSVYLKSDGKVWLSDRNEVTKMPVKGIAIDDVLADAEGVFLIEGFIRNDVWAWVIGALLYPSGVLGAITTTVGVTSGDQVQRVGIAVTADIIWFSPEKTVLEVT